jgi:hypothetical protein
MSHPDSSDSTSLAQSVLAPVDNGVPAMLAEIFMVRLEAEARQASEAAELGVGRFVPFVQDNQVAFKERTTRLCGPGLRPAAMVNLDEIEPPTD